MDARTLLRSHAIHDLRRLVPPAHYLLREHDPQADWELVQPLLQQPVAFELSPREHAAAQALSDLTMHELRFRRVFASAFPVQDYNPNGMPPLADSPGMTDAEKGELDARREVSRRSALVYARMVADPVLIEVFQPIADTMAVSAAAAVQTPDAPRTDAPAAPALIEPPRGLVYWRHVLYAHVLRIDAAFAPAQATARQAIDYMKRLKDGRLPDQGTVDVLVWVTDASGTKLVGAKTVGNALADARNHARDPSPVIPP